MDENEVVIKVENVSKDFILAHEKSGTVKGVFTSMFHHATEKKEKQHALKDISFEVKRGEFFGIVGRNGSGKSTLLKILAGIYQPTKGSIQTHGRLVPFIELGVGFNGELTGRDNVYLNGAMLGFSSKEVDAMYEEIVGFAELGRFMDQKLKNYSSGMQVRLAFSMATHAQADILVVDEVLAVGDADFQKKCFKYFRELKKQKKTVVFVSHDMSSVQEYCDKAILIEKSEIVVQGSTYDATTAYTRMFLEQEQTSEQLKTRKKRWGNELAQYTKAFMTPENFKNEKTVTMTTKLMARKDVNEAICGFKIKSVNNDKPLFGTNTKIKKNDLKNLRKGDAISLTWNVPNIFNTGSYFVDLSIQSEDYAYVYDWWEEAIIFSVERDEASSYSINPIVNVEAKHQ
jgi:ABC-2 type transport system ATP-binding protein